MGAGVDTPFAARLELARRQLSRAGLSGLPQHEQDQLASAAGEAGRVASNVAWLLPLAQPARGWHRVTTAFDLERAAYLWAGLLGCNACIHLRREGPQPAFCVLPSRRLDCRRCVQVLRKPSPEAADVCDLCRTRLDIPYFVPLMVQSGPMLIAGDVCLDCARALGLGDQIVA